MNCINPRFQIISCIGLEMVKTYFKLFLGKIHSKCVSDTGECHIFLTFPFAVTEQIEIFSLLTVFTLLFFYEKPFGKIQISLDRLNHSVSDIISKYFCSWKMAK